MLYTLLGLEGLVMEDSMSPRLGSTRLDLDSCHCGCLAAC